MSLHEDPWAVPCPTCEAKPDQPCKGARGSARAGCHQSRHEAATIRERQAADDRTAARSEAMHQAGRPEQEPWCKCQRTNDGQTICDEHRRIGLDAIARIRQQRAERGAA